MSDSNGPRRRFRFTPQSILLVLLTMGAVILGCSEDSTGPAGGPGEDFSGSWSFAYEVTGKRACGREIGDVGSADLVIVQVGNEATAIIDGEVFIDLAIDGSRVTGNGSFDGGALELDFKMTGDELKGAIDMIRSADECTEQLSGSATRSNEPPSPEFVGNWDMGITIESSECADEPAGAMNSECLTIAVSGNTVHFTDDGGTVAGVGDGDRAILYRNTAFERLRVEVLLGEAGTLTGSVYLNDLENTCFASGVVAGTRRTSPCPPPPGPGDFAGNWLVDVFSFSQTGCIGETEADYFGNCLTVSVQGETVTVDDGTGRGPVSGSVDGYHAVLTRVEDNGVYTIYLGLDDGRLEGEAVMNYTSGECTGTMVEISFAGTSISSSCDAEANGSFNGFWDITGEFTENSCGFSLSPYCEQFVQDGSSVFLANDGLEGTVIGNTLYVNVEDGLLSATQVLEMSAGGDSFTGVVTISLLDSESLEKICTSTADIVGTRTIDCAAGAKGAVGARILGLKQ